MASAKEFLAKHGLAIGTPSTIVFNSSGVLQASALSNATISVTGIDIDGATDIGADLVDADLLLVDDGAGGTNRKTALSRIKKYVYSAVSGDATVSDSGALTIASGAVENAMLTNSSITVTDGSNSTATALGGTITFAGTANETTVTESSGTVTIGLPDNVTLASNLNVGKNVVISGNLTVSGTQTVIDTNTVNIGDNIITLNSDETGTPSQNAGIEVERGSATNVVLRWNETSDKWQITNDGSSYQNLGESELVNDTSPQLGGALDLNSNNITGTGNINITGTSTISGLSSLSGAQFDGNVTPTSGQGVEIFAPDTSTGQIQSFDRTNSNFDKLIIKGDPVEIYDGSTKRIETTNSGVTVTGAVLATTAQIGGTNGVAVSQGAISIKNGGTQSYIDFYCESSNAHYARLQAPAHADFSGNITLTLPNEDDTIVGRATTDTLTNKTLSSPNISTPSISDPSITGKADIATIQLDTLAVENPASHHTYTVTVASKTSAHPYTGQGSSSAYFLDGKESPSIVLAPNMTYRFDQSSNTNSGHPLRFYLEADKTTAYTTGVTTNGTAGSSGAYTQIVVTDATPPVLYYQCSAHAYMGSVASSLTEGRLSDISDVHTATPTDGQALVWDNSNSYWAPGTVGAAITVQDEGSALSTSATTLNFVGAGVTASGTGATKTITISGGGGGSSLTVQDEGSALSTAATTLNFVGAGVTASGTGATKTITISGGGGGGSSLSIKDEGSALSTAATTLNFVGAGVTASGTGAEKTITIAGGGSGGTTPLGGAFQVGTGNGSTTTFASPLNTNIANNLIVSVDGIMQRPTTDYTVSGTTVTFGTAPPAGTAVMVRSFQGAMSTKSDFTVQNFTANGSNTVYKLVEGVTSGDHVLVSINGIIQRNGTDYTYNTGTSNITFDAAPTSGDIISFRTFDVQQSTSATVSDTAPSNPRNGDFWFDSSTAKLYMRYEDGSSNQWVSLSVAGAAGADGADGADGTPTVYANTSVLPSSGNTVGDLAFATLTKSLHVWDGSEWDRINSGGDENPRLTTTPETTHSLNNDGTNTAITIAASDPEGFPITYSHDTNPASPNQVTNIVENNGVFTLVPSTNTSHAGNFTLRLKASDGVHITSHAIAVSLVFSTPITFGLVNSGSAWASGGADATVTTNSTDMTDFRNNSGGGISLLNQTAGAALSAALPLGKKYFEFKYSDLTGYMQLGMMAQKTIDDAGSTTNGENEFVGTYENQYVISNYFYNGTEYKGNSTGYSLGSWNHTAILMIAYDTDTRAVWFGKNGSWHSTYNPLSGGQTSGVMEGDSSDQPRFYIGGASSGADGWKAYTMRGADLTYTPPSGYSSV